MHDMRLNSDGGSEFRLEHDLVSRARLKRLLSNHPHIAEWPAFKILVNILSPENLTIEPTSEEFGTIYSVLRFLQSHPEAPDKIFDIVANCLIARIGNGGVQKLTMPQVVDSLYEASIGLALSKKAGLYWHMQLDTNNVPDHEFVFRTFDGERRVAIECKNIREYTDIDRLIDQVASALRTANDQHAKRSPRYHDFVVFVDLPPSVFAQGMEQFYALVVNAFAALRLEGRTALDESRVLFTATYETNLHRLIECGYPYIGDTVFVPPHIAYKSGIEVSPGVCLLWNCLWSPQGGKVVPNNWANVAFEISNPNQYLVNRFRTDS